MIFERHGLLYGVLQSIKANILLQSQDVANCHLMIVKAIIQILRKDM